MREPVGSGAAAFAALSEGILTWSLHERSGLRVRADVPRVIIGSRVELGFGVGPARIAARCRVVQLIDEPQRAGFVYGTLAGHPEKGEESFAAVLDDDGTVYLELRAVARHSNWFYRLGAPVAEAAQALATRRYVEAARDLARP